MHKISILRHQLFKISEPFITQQAEQLKRFEPLYTGRQRFGSGPSNAQVAALEDIAKQRSLLRRLYQVVTRDPRPYLQLLAGREPVLIHAHFGVEGVYGLPLACQLGVPLITTFHGFDATLSNKALLTSGSPSWVNYALHRQKLAAKGDRFLCVSEFIRRRVIALGFPEERTFVHHIGIDTHAIHPQQSTETTLTIVHVARLVEKKGTEFLIRAFGQLKPFDRELSLVIIGDGPRRASLQELAEKLGISQHVLFKGAKPHDQVMDTMRRAHVLALPSVKAAKGDAEGLGMVLLEAAALGIPVVATKHGGIPEAVADSESGYLVPERDVDALANSLEKLISNNSLRQTMGKNARTMCETHFDIRRQTRKLEDHYHAVLA